MHSVTVDILALGLTFNRIWVELFLRVSEDGFILVIKNEPKTCLSERMHREMELLIFFKLFILIFCNLKQNRVLFLLFKHMHTHKHTQVYTVIPKYRISEFK